MKYKGCLQHNLYYLSCITWFFHKMYILINTVHLSTYITFPWRRHQMETFSALLAICAGNSPVPGEFPTQRQVTQSFDVFFDVCPNKRLTKHSWGWWVETPSPSLWRHCHAIYMVSLPYSLPKTLRLSFLNQFPPRVNFLRWREYPEHSFCIKCHYICALKRIFWDYTIVLV